MNHSHGKTLLGGWAPNAPTPSAPTYPSQSRTFLGVTEAPYPTVVIHPSALATPPTPAPFAAPRKSMYSEALSDDEREILAPRPPFGAFAAYGLFALGAFVAASALALTIVR